jgi:hypothetical protein
MASPALAVRTLFHRLMPYLLARGWSALRVTDDVGANTFRS